MITTKKSKIDNNKSKITSYFSVSSASGVSKSSKSGNSDAIVKDDGRQDAHSQLDQNMKNMKINLSNIYSNSSGGSCDNSENHKPIHDLSNSNINSTASAMSTAIMKLSKPSNTTDFTKLKAPTQDITKLKKSSQEAKNKLKVPSQDTSKLKAPSQDTTKLKVPPQEATKLKVPSQEATNLKAPSQDIIKWKAPSQDLTSSESGYINSDNSICNSRTSGDDCNNRLIVASTNIHPVDIEIVKFMVTSKLSKLFHDDNEEEVDVSILASELSSTSWLSLHTGNEMVGITKLQLDNILDRLQDENFIMRDNNVLLLM